MRIHLLANPARADALQRAREVGEFLLAEGCEVAADPDSAPLCQLETVPAQKLAEADLVVTLGGDGTLLRAAHLCSVRATPILGVFYGRFGFVTQFTGDDAIPTLRAFLKGSVEFEDRMMLQADLIRAGSTVASVHSLNETVIQRSADVRMLTFDVEVDGEYLTSYPADGVMISSPTGSTAYNLSAGGPVMDPNLRALVLTAIAPHTLSARTLVLHENSVIHIGLQTEGDAVVSADALTRLHLISGDAVEVRRSPRTTRLVRGAKSDFLSKLRDRLFWSKGMVERPQ